MWACHWTALTFKCICSVSRILYVPAYCANDLRICLKMLSKNTAEMHLGTLDGFYVGSYTCIIYKNTLMFVGYMFIVISTSVDCIGSNILWKMKGKGVENKWAIGDVAAICWPSLKRPGFFFLGFFGHFFRVIWNFMKTGLSGALFQRLVGLVLFHETPHHAPGIYSWQLAAQFS